MNTVFADTSFYLALLDQRDAMHRSAMAQAKTNRPILTTEFIVLELGNACSRAEDHGDLLALLAGMRGSPRTTIVPLDSGLLQRGMDLLANRPDKDWSLTDCISFVVMREHGISEALTGDRHFAQAGFTVLLA